MSGRWLAVALLLGVACKKAPEVPAAPADLDAEFWNWFAHEEVRLADGTKDSEARMLEITEHLHRAAPKLTGELSLNRAPNALQTLVVTANGMRAEFPAVTRVVEKAPPLTRWKVIAFRPRFPLFEAITIDGQKVKLEDFWFRETERTKEKVSIEVLVRGQTPENAKLFNTAAYIFFDHLLGEHDGELKLGDVSIFPLPGDPSQLKDVKPLGVLPGVVDNL